MIIKFWGVRGSIPTPGEHTMRYGGNTPCVEVRPTPDTFFIFDAGTGIHKLGDELIEKGEPVNAHIFLSHTHWDHIQGFPFFKPVLTPGNKFTVIGSSRSELPLKKILADQMEKMYFPLQFSELRANIDFKSVGEETFHVNNVEIRTLFVNHPGYTLGYRIKHNGKSIVYISDNEPFDREHVDASQNKVEKKVKDLYLLSNGDPNSRIIEFAKGADLFIHDSTYTPREYENKKFWGHSDYIFALETALRSEVKRFFLFHHGPQRSDMDIDFIVEDCKRRLRDISTDLVCEAAREGLTIEL